VTAIQVPSVLMPSLTPRCCPSHSDWATLAQHLVDEFPEVKLSVVVRELRDARDVVTSVALPDTAAIDVAEIIARHRLRIATGVIDDVARLDPQTG
jgi:hypothetical protein